MSNEALNLTELQNVIREFIVVQNLAKSVEEVPDDIVEYLSSEEYINTISSNYKSLPWNQTKVDLAVADLKEGIDTFKNLSAEQFAAAIETRNHNFYMVTGTIILSCLGWNNTGNPSLSLEIQNALPKTSARYYMNHALFKEYAEYCNNKSVEEVPVKIFDAMKIVVNEYMSETRTTFLRMLLKRRDDLFYEITNLANVKEEK